jgi:hypothetical protein
LELRSHRARPDLAGPDGTAKSSREFALLRVRDMTPANATVDGTSVDR